MVETERSRLHRKRAQELHDEALALGGTPSALSAKVLAQAYDDIADRLERENEAERASLAESVQLIHARPDGDEV